jgi:ABC-type branched-subunit amino acid transport system ATPase component
VTYGGIRGLDDVDLSVPAGQLLGLVGANGAGKSTLLDCLSGHRRPDSGAVHYDGADVTAMGPDRRAALGVIRSFQDGRLWPTLTAREAMLLATERSHRTGVVGALLGLPRWRAAERQRLHDAVTLAETMGLSPYLDHPAGELSTGVRRVLDLACMIALRPRVLLLDEPSAGLASAEAAMLPALLARVRRETGTAIMMVEHDLPLVFGVADRIVVLEEGRVVADGRPDDVRAHPAVSFGAR